MTMMRLIRYIFFYHHRDDEDCIVFLYLDPEEFASISQNNASYQGQDRSCCKLFSFKIDFFDVKS